jgi:predicted nucleic acid-binding protein
VATLILDVSVLIGLLDISDPHHGAAVDAVDAADHASPTTTSAPGSRTAPFR